MRATFVNTLIKEAKKDKNIFLLTSDLGFTVLEKFRDKFPDRFINVGVAEQNMIGVAAGLALSGKRVFAYSIASFSSMRPFEFIRNNIALHNLPVTIVGSGGGLAYSYATTTHHALEDICLMQAMPNMNILNPADRHEVKWATHVSATIGKPVYLRLGKTKASSIYIKPPRLQFGKGSIIKQGKDLAIFTTGDITIEVIQAAHLLQQKRVSTQIISLPTIKPLDKRLIIATAKKYPLIVTVEEHRKKGGLGTSIADCLMKNNSKTRLLKFGLPDKFIHQIGTHKYLKKLLGLTGKQMATQILDKHFNK